MNKVKFFILVSASLLGCQTKKNNETLSRTSSFVVKDSGQDSNENPSKSVVLPWPNYSGDFAKLFLETMAREKPKFTDLIVKFKEGKLGKLSSEDLCWYGKEHKEQGLTEGQMIAATYTQADERMSTPYPVSCEDLLKGMRANKTLAPLAKTIESRAKDAKVHVCTYLTLGLVPGLANYTVERLKTTEKGAH